MKQTGNTVLAFDKASARTFDKDGRLHVSSSHISRAAVNQYLGREIPKWQDLGLDPQKVYHLYRDPAELEKAAPTFRNIQLMRKHIYVNADDPKKEEIVGSIGSDVTFNAPFLDASLCIWDAEAIAMIESGALKELSCGYHYTADMTPGVTPDGEAYDGRMVDIEGNHLTLCERGRAGSDVIVADSMPKELASIVGSGAKSVSTAPEKKEATAMKTTKLGRALKVALSAASPKIAQDSALQGLVGGAVAKTFDRKKAVQAICAMDEDMSPEKVDEIVDAVLGVEENPEPSTPPAPVAKDEDDDGAKSKHAEIIDYLKAKGLDERDLEAVGNMLTRLDRPYGQDAEPPVDVEEEVKTAMDSLRAEFRELEKAKQAVRPVVGDVIGMDSAEAVYRFALDNMKVDHKDMPAAGLATLFSVASAKKESAPARVAMDSATVAKAIPGLARFRTV